MLFRKSGDAGTDYNIKNGRNFGVFDRLQWPKSMTECSNLNECNSNESLEIFKLLYYRRIPPS